MHEPDLKTVAVYSDRANDYDAMVGNDGEGKALNDFISRLPEQGRALDLGCGPGRHAKIMLDRGLKVDALDATPEFVEMAKAKGVNARLGRFEDLNSKDTYDGVWASFSLLHAPRADLPRHLNAIKWALKPQGQLFLGMKLGQGDERDELGRFYSYFSVDELHTHLQEAGFDIVETREGHGVGLAGRADPFALIFAQKAGA